MTLTEFDRAIVRHDCRSLDQWVIDGVSQPHRMIPRGTVVTIIDHREGDRHCIVESEDDAIEDFATLYLDDLIAAPQPPFPAL